MSLQLKGAEFRKTGGSTAVAANVTYRLGKLERVHPVRGRWLDCGCSDGGYTEGLVARGADSVVGIDVDVAEMAGEQRAHPEGRSGLYGCGVSESLPFRDGAFDGALLNEVLEHVVDDRRCLAELFRVLRPGGTLVLMSPNRCFPFETHGMVVGETPVLMPVPFLPWLPPSIGTRFMRARNYWPGELFALVKEAGFVIEVRGSVLPVFEVFPLLPSRLAGAYRRLIPRFERLPLIRFASVSTFILARKPSADGTPR